MTMQFVALCGYPAVGKSEVQLVLKELYGFQIVDDAKPLREAAKILYDLDDWHVSTQEGKATILNLGERRVTVRQVLGELGDHLEESDPYHMPRRARERAMAVDQKAKYSFGSVRKDQGCFLKDCGGTLVIEVSRSGCKPRGDFDEYDRGCIDFSIENDFDESNPEASKARLLEAVADMLDPIFPRSAEQLVSIAS